MIYLYAIADPDVALPEAPGFEDAPLRRLGEGPLVAVVSELEERARDESDEARALAEAIDGKPEGGAYIARKKLDALVRDEADRILDEVVRETHARLEEWAAASVVLPAQSRELAGYQGQMVFNAAYLVEDSRTERFTSLVGGLDDQYRDAGVAFQLTGPWPAYNFVKSSIEAAR